MVVMDNEGGSFLLENNNTKEELIGEATKIIYEVIAIITCISMGIALGMQTTFKKKRGILTPAGKRKKEKRKRERAREEDKNTKNTTNGGGGGRGGNIGTSLDAATDGGRGASSSSLSSLAGGGGGGGGGTNTNTNTNTSAGRGGSGSMGGSGDEIRAALTAKEARIYIAAVVCRVFFFLLAFSHIFTLVEGSKKRFYATSTPFVSLSYLNFAAPEFGMGLAWLVQLVVSGVFRRDMPSPLRRAAIVLSFVAYVCSIGGVLLPTSTERRDAWHQELFVLRCVQVSLGALVLLFVEIFLVSRKKKSKKTTTPRDGRKKDKKKTSSNGDGDMAYVLLPEGSEDQHDEEKGAYPEEGDSDEDDDLNYDDEDDEDEREWWQLVSTAWAFLWPRKMSLQLRVFGCLSIVVIVRVFNVLLPLQYKKLVDRLYDASANAPTKFDTTFYPTVVLYMLLFYFLGGGLGSMGLLSNMRQYLWIPVQQDTYRRVSIKAVEHILQLPLGWHLGRRTGELLKVLDRGTGSLTTILQILLFSVGPTLLDIVIAAGFFWLQFDLLLAGIVFVTLGLYVPMTVIVTEWRVKYRREMNLADNRKTQRVSDAVINYETIKYFTAEEHESLRYGDAIGYYQEKEFINLATLNALNVVQASVVFAGMAAGLSVITYRVCESNSSGWTASDAVLFLSYLQQLYTPLNFLGTYYRAIQQALIDVENLLELLSTKSSVEDAPNALPYVAPAEGTSLELRNVVFAYPGRAPVLKGISFSVRGGQTLALVGATGCGKSTILRLLFRFYDPVEGAVLFNGADVRTFTQLSLHAAVGVVPQDTVLFNDTIAYNIGYGRREAEREEVVDAARAAQIHETIEANFPAGYETLVGERGLRLSGGEKQRVSFARAYLKRPALLLLDEATSSLDSRTEAAMSSSLASLRKSCTTVIVAHRLSTIADADLIVVLKEGRIAESGSHEQLLAEQTSLYRSMWQRQQAMRSDDDIGSSVE